MSDWCWKYKTVDGVTTVCGMIDNETGQELSLSRVEDIVNLFKLSPGSLAGLLKGSEPELEADGESLSMSLGVLRDFVTVLEMKARAMYLPSLFGDVMIHLYARKPQHDILDEAILFGNGYDGPLGVANANASIQVTREARGGVCGMDIYNMMDASCDLASARWVARSNLLPALSSIRGPTGDYLLSLPPDRTMLGIPVTWVDDFICQRNNFDIALLDLRYYVLGEYEGMIDGQPLIAGPLISADKTTATSPFVFLAKWSY